MYFVLDVAADSSNENIFLTLLKNCPTKTRLFCSDKKPKYYQERLKKDDIEYFDSSESSSDVSPFDLPPIDLLLTITSSELTVFVDNISYYMWNNSSSHILRSITSSVKIGLNFVICIFRDTLPSTIDTSVFKRYSSHYVSVLKRIDSRSILVEIFEKKNGHISSKMEILTFDDNLNVNSSAYRPDEIKCVSDNSIPVQSLATFNLGTDLSESEKNARNALVLPYLR